MDIRHPHGLLDSEEQFLADFRVACERWSTGDQTFPERLHHTAMAADLLGRLHAATADWARDWLERVSEWDDVGLDAHKRSLARGILEPIANATQPSRPDRSRLQARSIVGNRQSRTPTGIASERGDPDPGRGSRAPNAIDRPYGRNT